jgi:hypothetical protein
MSSNYVHTKYYVPIVKVLGKEDRAQISSFVESQKPI